MQKKTTKRPPNSRESVIPSFSSPCPVNSSIRGRQSRGFFIFCANSIRHFKTGYTASRIDMVALSMPDNSSISRVIDSIFIIFDAL